MRQLLLAPLWIPLFMTYAAAGMGIPTLLPSLVRFSSALPITVGLLVLGLVCRLDEVGWNTVRDDFRHPARTARLMLARRRGCHEPQRGGTKNGRARLYGTGTGDAGAEPSLRSHGHGCARRRPEGSSRNFSEESAGYNVVFSARYSTGEVPKWS